MGNIFNSKSTCALPEEKFNTSVQLWTTFYLTAMHPADVRFFKVVINRWRSSFEPNGEIGWTDGDWRSDYIKYVESQVNIPQSCYMFFRLDTVTNGKYDWLLIVLDPELKYDYAKNSFQASIKIQFGHPVALTYLAIRGNNLRIDNFVRWYQPKNV